MGTKSAIEWTDATWNPVRGCTMAKGSEAGGCLNCYAARNALRRPDSGLAIMRPSGPRWTGKVELVEKHLADPLRWREPKRIFVNSLSDLFHEAITDVDLLRIFTVMGNTHLGPGAGRNHVLQVLTKRARRMRDFVSRLRWTTALGFTRFSDRNYLVNNMPSLVDLENPWVSMRSSEGKEPMQRPAGWMPDNIWLGVSVENQATANVRIPDLLATPAAVRFVSYEPALEMVTFRPFLFSGVGSGRLNGLHWIIVGGESGPDARPFSLRWARSAIKECRDGEIACFVKQLGKRPGTPSCADFARTHPDCSVAWLKLQHQKGGDMSEWPEDLRVREFPALGVAA